MNNLNAQRYFREVVVPAALEMARRTEPVATDVEREYERACRATTERMEPDITSPDNSYSYASIAISMKRIAEVLERLEKVLQEQP